MRGKIIRLLYQLKAFICLHLNRWHPLDEYGENGHIIDGMYVLEKRGGTSFDSYHSVTYYWYSVYGVGRGLFKNWWVFAHQDTSD